MTSDPCRVGPEADLTGLGVRIGLYMQCIALPIAAVTGFEQTLTVIPSAIMTALVLNIILAMKASVHVFDLVPKVQDSWVAQTQLFLLTIIVPFTMLFDRWNDLRRVKNVLALLTVLSTYVQAFRFWFTGYKQSDELVCGTAESELRSWKLFSQHARWAIIVLYIFGAIVVLAAWWTYGTETYGLLSRMFRYMLRTMDANSLSMSAFTERGF
jgi:MFS superfamily sulfate permease-like transporter